MDNNSMLVAKYFLFVLAVSIFPLSSNAATMYVEKYGDDFSACTRADPCNKIQDAIDLARINSKILVGPGVYEENLVIRTRGLKLESTAGVTSTQIRGDLATVNVPAITIEADLVSIGRKFGKGFTIYADNAPAVKVGKLDPQCVLDPTSGNYSLLTQIIGYSRSKIEGNSIHTNLDNIASMAEIGYFCNRDGTMSTKGFLPALEIYATDITVSENVIVSQGNYVANIKVVSRSAILNNVMKLQFADAPRFTLRHDALIVDGVTATNLIRGNVVHDDRIDHYRNESGYGITAFGSKTTITNNQISGFLYGIEGDLVKSIDKNIVTSANYGGILSYDAKFVRDNTVVSSEETITNTGIYVIGMKNGLFTGNTVVGNGEGVYIDLDSSSWIRVFSANNIYNNGVPGSSDCGIYFYDINKPIRILRTWFGDPTSPRDQISLRGVSPTGIPGDHICAYPGIVDNSTGTINNLKVTPSRVPNRVKAIFRRVVL